MKKALVILVCTVLILSLCACGAIKAQVVGQLKSAVAAAESALASAEADTTVAPTTEETTAPENTTEPQDTSEATSEPTKAIDTSGEKGFWPKEIPDFVPAFKSGAYVKEKATKLEDGTGVTLGMAFNGVTKDDMDAYNKVLKDAKFEIISGETDGNYSIAGSLKSGDKTLCNVVISWTENDGVCAYVLNIPK